MIIEKGTQMRRRRPGAVLATALIMAIPALQAQPAQAAQTTASIVQIVAHEDDDLLFMNPDLSNSIKVGVPITTVYLTAGEAGDGVDYARQRQAGAMASYAQMLNVPCPDNSCWDGEDVSVGTGGGHVVEHYWLGNVNLYFLDLHEGGTDRYADGGALRRIWNGGTEDTLPMFYAPYQPQTYSRSGLTDVLTSIMTSSRATLIRVQDPAPDPTLAGELNFPAGFNGDNPDHTTAAWFADEAAGRYSAAQLSSYRVVVDHYRDYNIQDTPANLTGAATAEKVTTFEGAYAPYDEKLPWTGEAPTTCDPVNSTYQCWESRQQYRTPRSTQSVTSDTNGALHAFAVESGKLFEWTEVNGSWTGPKIHDQAPGPLAAGVSVGHDQDGRIEAFCQRADTGEIVTSFQSSAPGGWSWGSLGNPNQADPNPLKSDALQVSAPVAASNADGRLQVFVRNRGGGISSASQMTANGLWSGWVDMGGSGIQEAPAAFTTRDGRIELFAWAPQSSTASVLHWFQPAANQPLLRDAAFPNIAPTSAPTVAMDQNGRLELLYRQLDGKDPLVETANSYTMSLWQTSPGVWAPASGPIGGGPDDGGIGAPAAVTTGDGRIVAFVRNEGGGISTARQNSANGSFGGWSDLGGPGVGIITGVPAASVDRNGFADLVVLGLDGRMYHNRQNSNGSFAGWKAMG